MFGGKDLGRSQFKSDHTFALSLGKSTGKQLKKKTHVLLPTNTWQHKSRFETVPRGRIMPLAAGKANVLDTNKKKYEKIREKLVEILKMWVKNWSFFVPGFFHDKFQF